MEINDDGMNATPDDYSESDRDLRLRNQLKKMELAAKYGAHFGEGDSKAPPKIEEQFLNYVEEFERQFQQAQRTTVRAFVGNPSFKPLTDIPLERLKDELDQVLEFLASCNVVIDFLCEVPVEEKYRFVTEELLDVETDDIRIEGMNHHFIYEEFHPNDEYDAKQCADDVLSGIFWLEADLFSHYIAKEGVRDADNQPLTREQMMKSLMDFRASFHSFERPVIETQSCRVNGDSANVTASIQWSGKVDAQSPPVSKSGVSRLELTRSPYGGWDVLQLILPGFNQE
jgi:hypothetical protein